MASLHIMRRDYSSELPLAGDYPLMPVVTFRVTGTILDSGSLCTEGTPDALSIAWWLTLAIQGIESDTCAPVSLR